MDTTDNTSTYDLSEFIFSKKNLSLLVKTILKKKELSSLNPAFVEERLIIFLKNNKKLSARLQQNFHQKSAAFHNIVKNMRHLLRRSYGLYHRKDMQPDWTSLFQKSTSEKDKQGIIKQILSTHSSTKERLPYYIKLYQDIFTLTGMPKTIIDLGSGINPLSLDLLDKPIMQSLRYYAYDISEAEIDALNYYFYQKHLANKFFTGKASILDIISFAQISQLPKADICFLFKITDILDQGKGHKNSEIVITRIPADYIIVSFPTLTMSGKLMNFPRRKWIELMCNRLGFSFKIITSPNELFYVIKKIN
ncbi:hypothetical protein HYX12_04300 [Candidatus Woesearchaeota archaeon]|nr:hypothetical protein [Candidatus Woesearchaeota archaeon]